MIKNKLGECKFKHCGVSVSGHSPVAVWLGHTERCCVHVHTINDIMPKTVRCG